MFTGTSAKHGGRPQKNSFETHKTQWKKTGRCVCRHGVFFDASVLVRCPCLDLPLIADWSEAMLMLAIDSAMKCLTVDTFEAPSFQRFGILLAELRRRGL